MAASAVLPGLYFLEPMLLEAGLGRHCLMSVIVSRQMNPTSGCPRPEPLVQDDGRWHLQTPFCGTTHACRPPLSPHAAGPASLIAELALLGLGTGFLAGLLGIGGGMVLVPFLTPS